VIDALATDTEIKAVAVKYGGTDADDIFQTALERMLTLPTETKAQLIEDNGTRYYFRQIVYRLCMERHRKPTHASLEHDPEADDYDPTDDNRIAAIRKELESLHWYDRDLFLLYIELGSSRKVQASTGIHYRAVCATVNKVKNELRDRLLHRDI
jgi:DNA-directed RNA polymerase specialized sigma24 family protein